MSQREQVRTLYKTLLFYGREYPNGHDYFRERLKKAFWKNKDITDPARIDQMIKHGQYIIKELESLYMLKKYRTMKRRYYPD